MYNIHSHYENIFSLVNQNKVESPAVGYLYPFGSTDYENIEFLKNTGDNFDPKTIFLCYDQEPLIHDYNKKMFNQFKNPYVITKRQKKNYVYSETFKREIFMSDIVQIIKNKVSVILLNTEKNSKEINRVSKIYTEVISGKRNIYCFLFSSNIKDSEKKYIEQLKHCCKVNLTIINEKNFYNYENEEIPIHPYFKFLSDTNKAYYAKSYMRYFYGGGYPEIEAKIFDWNIYFDELFLSRNDSIICGDDVKNNIKLFENFQYVFKPKTRSSFDYIEKIHHILDKKQYRNSVK
jgi:hypothetical protein